LFYKILEFIYK